jgi:hypothetical protein
MTPLDQSQVQNPEDKAREEYYTHLYLSYRQEEQLRELETLPELPEDYEVHSEFYKTQTHPS